MNFVYAPLPYRVLFAAGAVERVREETDRIGRRALVLCTPEQRTDAERVLHLLGATGVGIYDHAAMHVPVSIVEDALRVASALDADCVVAVGGGSTTGLAKALSLRADLPSLAIPTTYAGSEVTPIWGMTENGTKTTGKDPRVLPRTVIYDPTLTASLPVDISIASGLNAIAHCIEGLYAFDGNPITSLMAEEGIRAVAASLPMIHRNAQDAVARERALYGSWLAGSVLGSCSVALHHKLCHTLGGAFDMPHAQTHAALLPHVVAYNRAAAPDELARADRALGNSEAAGALFRLAEGLGVEMALGKIGLPRDRIAYVADLATRNPYPNPRPVTKEGIEALLERAHRGLPPN